METMARTRLSKLWAKVAVAIGLIGLGVFVAKAEITANSQHSLEHLDTSHEKELMETK